MKSPQNPSLRLRSEKSSKSRNIQVNLIANYQKHAAPLILTVSIHISMIVLIVKTTKKGKNCLHSVDYVISCFPQIALWCFGSFFHLRFADYVVFIIFALSRSKANCANSCIISKMINFHQSDKNQETKKIVLAAAPRDEDLITDPFRGKVDKCRLVLL